MRFLSGFLSGFKDPTGNAELRKSNATKAAPTGRKRGEGTGVQVAAWQTLSVRRSEGPCRCTECEAGKFWGLFVFVD
jgi:hypothetical protein